ncbi:MAG: hypothetical protein BMS9Abin36_0178 [Gammaproteobacteria bacterium]|nr:MAG: hypothetical protein BMS9Abin36_0178 [Gammaproteobacteria bacterium]
MVIDHIICVLAQISLRAKVGFVVLALSPLSPMAHAVGLMTVPTLNNADVSVTMHYDPATYWNHYNYTVSNPAENTGEVWYIKIDISYPLPKTSSKYTSGLTIPFGTKTLTFDELLAVIEPFYLPAGGRVVPIGQEVPEGWAGGFGKDGFAGFATRTSMPGIMPGTQQDGFAIISLGPPTIREVRVKPRWQFIVDGPEETTDEERQQAVAIKKHIEFTTLSLGPTDVSTGVHEVWNRLRTDIIRAQTLGWIPDTAFADDIISRLSASQTTFREGDPTVAKLQLEPILPLLDNATPSQISQIGADLIRYNVMHLLRNIGDTPIPVELKYSLTPSTANRTVGETHTVTFRVVNVAHNDDPVSQVWVQIMVASGPNASPMLGGFVTDVNGEAFFSYQGKKEGKDRIVVFQQLGMNDQKPKQPILLAGLGALPGIAALTTAATPTAFFGSILAEAEVIWSGGPDLVVPFFAPPRIPSYSGTRLKVDDVTENIGNLPSSESVTRYYLSTTDPIDIPTATVIGERVVPPLEPGASSSGPLLEFDAFPELVGKKVYLAACADAPAAIAELSEENNCSFHQLEHAVSTVMIVEKIANLPPDCTSAAPSATTLWPPNHKLKDIAIQGVMDEDGDAVTLTIDSITQDEPVNGLGDGDTSPDGFGIGAPIAQLRAERSGLGNGRVYQVSFTANDGKGGTCSGVVGVGVPHDQGQGSEPVDDGQLYDSIMQ